ncbi:hypothetical protein CAE01nite_20560 [Cellulomonas aerilata]|uniref:Uncharacterized protein n=2 Tax=Cellulomonas aerilata TaxID=515326 RepID=A0A512DCY5_9CELL|nr:hypothetical protein CAE01nite_20560 [Cellulomonas aerilata]
MGVRIRGLRGQLIAALVATSTVVVAAPALAEGSFNSTVSGVRVGFESRSWADRNVDGAATRARITACSVGGVGIGIFRERFGPDALIARGSTCDAYVSGGRVASGNYHFTVERIGGSNLNGNVRVEY